jgi:hypothetical protein
MHGHILAKSEGRADVSAADDDGKHERKYQMRNLLYREIRKSLGGYQ